MNLKLENQFFGVGGRAPGGEPPYPLGASPHTPHGAKQEVRDLP